MTRSSATEIHPPRAHTSHRAGPVELEADGEAVQRCLRCDILLRHIQPSMATVKPLDVGRRVFDLGNCSGRSDRPAPDTL